VVFFLFKLIINHPHLKEIIMSSTTVTRGNSHETFYIKPSLTPAEVATVVSPAQTFALPGLQTTDVIKVIGLAGAQTSGIVVAQAYCAAVNVLTIQFGNITAGALTPAAGAYTLEITRLEGPAPTTAV
jgi:hypothetical protein